MVRFGEKYKQWNAAFDAGFAAALGKPIVTLHDPTTHALKEIDRAAMATAEQPEQVVDVLRSCSTGRCPPRPERGAAPRRRTTYQVVVDGCCGLPTL